MKFGIEGIFDWILVLYQCFTCNLFGVARMTFVKPMRSSRLDDKKNDSEVCKADKAFDYSCLFFYSSIALTMS